VIAYEAPDDFTKKIGKKIRKKNWKKIVKSSGSQPAHSSEPEVGMLRLDATQKKKVNSF
jgi:hypothetical protein